MDELELIVKYIKPLVEHTPEAFGLLDDVAAINLSRLHREAVPLSTAERQGRPKVRESLVGKGAGKKSANSPAAAKKTTLGMNNAGYLITTTDCMVEGKHFFPFESPKSIAYRLMISNLSDLATKGAKPLFFLLTFCPPSIQDLPTPWVKEFFASLNVWQKEFGVSLIGGNTSATGSNMMLSATFIGVTSSAPAAELTLRTKALPQDYIYVTQHVGGAFLGYQVIRSERGWVPHPGWLKGLGAEEKKVLSHKYYYPAISMALGSKVSQIANACTDASDGLLLTVLHLARASGLKMRVNLHPKMFSELAWRIIQSLNLEQFKLLIPDLVNWGGDYNLVFTSAHPPAVVAEALKDTKVPLACIGRVLNSDPSDTKGGYQGGLCRPKEPPLANWLEVKDFVGQEISLSFLTDHVHK